MSSSPAPAGCSSWRHARGSASSWSRPRFRRRSSTPSAGESTPAGCRMRPGWRQSSRACAAPGARRQPATGSRTPRSTGARRAPAGRVRNISNHGIAFEIADVDVERFLPGTRDREPAASMPRERLLHRRLRAIVRHIAPLPTAGRYLLGCAWKPQPPAADANTRPISTIAPCALRSPERGSANGLVDRPSRRRRARRERRAAARRRPRRPGAGYGERVRRRLAGRARPRARPLRGRRLALSVHHRRHQRVSRCCSSCPRGSTRRSSERPLGIGRVSEDGIAVLLRSPAR